MASLQADIDRFTRLASGWNTAIIVLMVCAAISATGLVIAQKFAFRYSDRAAFASGRLSTLKETIADGKTALAIESAAKANERVACAEEEAAKANKAAEDERIARAKLEAQIQPRQITKNGGEALKGDLSRILAAGSIIVIRSYAMDIEGGLLGGQLLETVRAGGRFKGIDQRSAFFPQQDAVSGVVVRGPRSQSQAVSELVSAIAKAGVSASTDGQDFPGGILILVGVKPLPLLREVMQ